MAAIDLPLLTAQGRESLPVLTAPSHPPTNDDFVTSIMFQSDLALAYNRQKITKDDLINGYTYATAMAAQLLGPANVQRQDEVEEEATPAWFGAAMQAALAPLTAHIKDNSRQLKKLARMTAILFNESRTGGSNERFEIVNFPNLEDPTMANHNLPPLTSRAAILALSEVQKKAYYQGYYPGGRARGDERDALIYAATGIRMN